MSPTADFTKYPIIHPFKKRSFILSRYHLQPGWVVTGPSGESWPDVNLDEEFAEYDEKADVSITVLNAEMSIAPVKGGGK